MKKLIRSIVSHKADFSFRKCHAFSLDKDQVYGLYVHIPFCKHCCPYCPYFKTVYKQEKAEEYLRALKMEIERESASNPSLKVNSLYIGGGTPTLLESGLVDLIVWMKSKFVIRGEIAIETAPTDLSKEQLLALKNAGVSSISIGIQSLKDHLLRKLGRNYDARLARHIIQLVKEANFDTFNVDMMFALPGQSLEDVEDDIRDLLRFSPTQITFYPLFTFPYTSVGRFKALKKVQMPNFFLRRKMYYAIADAMMDAGYEQSSVWAFKKKNTVKYSSVTRDFYIGFGPSAGTYTGSAFYFNTFSIEDYCTQVSKRKPVILRMNVNDRMRKIFWLYWRLYETAIPLQDYKRLFHAEFRKDFRLLFILMRALGFVRHADEQYLQLSRRGIFYIHLLQNIFALDYINKIWSVCQKCNNPDEVHL